MSQLSAGHDHHDPHVAHHFDSAGQQFSSGKLGMWLFLSTEVLFFGGLFCFYSVWRGNHPEIFETGSLALDWKLGAVNTIVLILSSFTMAWGVSAAQQGKIKLLKILLSLTILGGFAFMGIKAVEYSAKFEHKTVWGLSYGADDDYLTSHYADEDGPEIVPLIGDPPSSHDDGESHDEAPAEPDHSEEAAADAGDAGAADGALFDLTVDGEWDPYVDAEVEITHSQIEAAASGQSGLAGDRVFVARSPVDPEIVQTYFSIYFCLTGLHGIHVVIGIGLMFWLLRRAHRGDFGPKFFTPVDLVGLYWHLVDLIWIFLFPLLYLI